MQHEERDNTIVTTAALPGTRDSNRKLGRRRMGVRQASTASEGVTRDSSETAHERACGGGRMRPPARLLDASAVCSTHDATASCATAYDRHDTNATAATANIPPAMRAGVSG